MLKTCLRKGYCFFVILENYKEILLVLLGVRSHFDPIYPSHLTIVNGTSLMHLLSLNSQVFLLNINLVIVQSIV